VIKFKTAFQQQREHTKRDKTRESKSDEVLLVVEKHTQQQFSGRELPKDHRALQLHATPRGNAAQNEKVESIWKLLAWT
jgi:hypothetical protein